MSVTVCQESESRELHLVNIVSFSEDKLSTNFSRILWRLNSQEEKL